MLSPSWPLVFRPQAQSEPSLLSETVCADPAAAMPVMRYTAVLTSLIGPNGRTARALSVAETVTGMTPPLSTLALEAVGSEPSRV